MLAVAAALAVSACSGNGDNPSSSAHKHSAAPDAPWQHDNNNHWKDCAANDGGKAENAKHTFGDPTDVVPATCTATGSQKVKCTVCGAEVTQTLPMIDHTWGEWEVTAEADCTNAGSRKHTCTVCQTEEAEEIPANGHSYGEWEVTKEATCDKAGSQKRTCSVCGDVEEQVIESLGHDLELVGGETPAPAGEATVRLYRCKRCGETSLGFAANEPSEASLPHLMEGANGGMRFFGRPIGNAMALTADGTSVNQQNNECVYCSTETGDFFEYVFTLNADQAATLASARLYCDARPADYLSGDFWAYNRSADDWTPGYYIDGADDHVQKDATTGEVVMVKDHAQAVKQEDGSWAEGVELETEVKMGARIEDYRYILYVDGNPVDFDADTSVPVKGSNTNMQRAEYVLPYTFNLHEGKNTISLRMAGGYRSEFYNFIFRPYVEPTQITVNEDKIEIREGQTAQITSSMEGLTYASSNTRVATVDANGLVTGVAAGTATITVSKEGNYKDAKVPVTILEKEGIINLDLTTGVVAPEGSLEIYTSAGGNGTRLRNFQKDGAVTYTFNADKAGLYEIQLRGSAGGNLAETIAVKVNDAAVAVSGQMGGSTYSPVDVVIGQADLVAGENKLEIKCLAEGSSMAINGIKLFPHVHEWTEAEAPVEGANDAVVAKYTCAACGMVKYEIAAKTAKMVLASGSAWKTDPTSSADGAFKLNKDGHSASFTFALPKGFQGKMYQRCYMDSYNSNKTKKMFYQTNNHACIEVKVNDNAIDLSQYETTTFQQVFGDELNGSNSVTKDVELGNVTLGTANTINYTRVETLNTLVTHFVFIGREAA